MTSRVYHGYQQVLSQLRSALPILPSTQRPDFQLIFKRLLSKSACLRGSAPDPAGGLQHPQTPSWKRLILTTLLRNRSRAIAQRCVLTAIGVRDGGAGGAAAPPIRAVCRHEFGQRVNIIRAKHNTCLNNTNLGSVTGVNGKNPNLGSVTVGKGKNSATPFLPLPPPPPLNMDPGKWKISATTPPPH